MSDQSANDREGTTGKTRRDQLGFRKLDGDELRRVLVKLDLTAGDIAAKGPSITTIRNILNGKPGQTRRDLVEVIRAFLKERGATYEDLIAINLIDRDSVPLHEQTTPNRIATRPFENEWSVDFELDGPRTASNGLRFRLFKLKHTLIEGRYSRAKCYDINSLNHIGVAIARVYLLRHASICHKLKGHPNIPELHAMFHSENRENRWGEPWWVLDEWIEGPTLEERRASGPIPLPQLKEILQGIAAGLSALHREEIIRRELSPRYVLLAPPLPNSKESRRPILTDFEIAKLLDGSPTVAPRPWREDPYRAPEVAGNSEISVHADIYSWAAIMIYAATGKQASMPAEWLELVEDNLVPKALKSLARKCLQVIWDKRPKDMDAIERELRSWKP